MDLFGVLELIQQGYLHYLNQSKGNTSAATTAEGAQCMNVDVSSIKWKISLCLIKLCFCNSLTELTKVWDTTLKSQHFH